MPSSNDNVLRQDLCSTKDRGAEHWVLPGSYINNSGANVLGFAWDIVYPVLSGQTISFVLIAPQGSPTPGVKLPNKYVVDCVECVIYDTSNTRSSTLSGEIKLPDFGVPYQYAINTTGGWNTYDATTGSQSGNWTIAGGAALGLITGLTNSTAKSDTSLTILNSVVSSQSFNVDMFLSDDTTTVRIPDLAVGPMQPADLGSYPGSYVPMVDSGTATITGTAIGSTTSTITFGTFGIGAAGGGVSASFSSTIALTSNGFISGVLLTTTIPGYAITAESSASVTGTLTPANDGRYPAFALYIAKYQAGLGYHVRNITSPMDAVKSYLDYVVDAYSPPSGAFGFTSRTWRLKLKEPVVVGYDEALLVTFYNGSVNPLSILPYIRSRIVELT